MKIEINQNRAFLNSVKPGNLFYLSTARPDRFSMRLDILSEQLSIKDRNSIPVVDLNDGKVYFCDPESTLVIPIKYSKVTVES